MLISKAIILTKAFCSKNVYKITFPKWNAYNLTKMTNLTNNA